MPLSTSTTPAYLAAAHIYIDKHSHIIPGLLLLPFLLTCVFVGRTSPRSSRAAAKTASQTAVAGSETSIILGARIGLYPPGLSTNDCSIKSSNRSSNSCPSFQFVLLAAIDNQTTSFIPSSGCHEYHIICTGEKSVPTPVKAPRREGITTTS
ncbi:hypothetical protein F4802DRAFT_474789 [Xylaria palmicola]|nr:hypothetical protein F4802DRAFT_474789 [Xylaria palmicola]